MDLAKLDFKKGAPVKKITLVKNYELIGNVSDKFKTTKSFEFLKPDVATGLKADAAR
ncbi:hypothetical protein [Bdellovibrio bacteriovorus]|uniref:hypothetical protein n=1 Tax=Bdellovibrio bacteriovorus TaxID=959 RepID=UPI0035A6ABD5